MDMRGPEAQKAYNILMMLNRQTCEIVSFFKADWESTFSSWQVPAEQMFNNNDKQGFGIVRVNRLKAMEYLKNRFNFYSPDERVEALNELAEDFEKESRDTPPTTIRKS